MTILQKLILFVAPVALIGCTASLNSRFISSSGGSIPLGAGAVYHLPSERLEISGAYQILKVTGVNGAGVIRSTTYQLLPAPDASVWTVAIVRYGDPNLAYSINPDADRKGNIAYSGDNDANKISIGENGLLTGLNYSPDDRSLAIATNTIKTIANIGTLASFPASAFAAAAVPAAPGEEAVMEEITYATQILGTIPFKAVCEVDNVLNRGAIQFGDVRNQMKLSPILAQLKSSKQIDDEKFNKNDPISKMTLPLLKVSSTSKINTSAYQIKKAIKELAVGVDKKAGAELVVRGVVVRYPGDASIAMMLGRSDGQVIYTASVRLMAAGGIQHIPLKSQRFSRSRDALTFSPTTGALSEWSYGRESSAERATGAAADLTGLTGTTLAAYAAKEDAQATAERTRVGARLDLQAAVENAQYDLDKANADQRIAQTSFDAALKARSANPTDSTLQATFDAEDLKLIGANKAVGVANAALKKARAMLLLAE